MAKAATIKNDRQEAHLVRVRIGLSVLVVLLASAILLSRLVYLQIFQYEKFTTASEANRIKLQPVPPTRGLIFDRNGVLVADNRPSFTLSVHPKHTKSIEDTLAKLEDIVGLREEEKIAFHKRLKRSRRPDDAVAVRFNLSEAEIATLAVNRHLLSGVEVQAELIRHYPHAELTAHVVGYVGRINEREEAQIDKEAYAGTRHIGKTGVEHAYEQQLLGELGFQRVETDARGRASRVLERFDPKPGQNLNLFLDLRVQRVAQEALGEHRGAVVALELPTGGVVSMASTPSFNANLFVQGIDQASYDALNLSRKRPLFNRVLKGQYPPGSTIKPMVALAGLEHGAMSWSKEIQDPGFYQLPGDDHQYRDWKRRGHGRVNMHRAVVQSCDTYFYELSHRLGVNNLHSFLSLFGLGNKTGIDVGFERSGLIPSPDWKRAHRGLPWYPGETLIMGIGQGFMLATPLQLAVATGILASNGQMPRPRLWQQAPALPIWPEKMQPVDQLESGTVLPWRYTNWQRIVESMEAVVHGPEGTARRAGAGAAYRMAGKTGTAQVVAIPQGEEYDAETLDEWLHDHALFVAFAPVDNPLVAVAVVVENGGSGSGTAAPIARKVLDAYLLGTY